MTAGAIRHAKLQSNHYHQQTNTQQMPFCPTNSVRPLKGKSVFVVYLMLLRNGIQSDAVLSITPVHTGEQNVGANVGECHQQNFLSVSCESKHAIWVQCMPG